MANFYDLHWKQLGYRVAQTSLLALPLVVSGCASPWRLWRRDEPSLEQLLVHPAPWDAEMRGKDDVPATGRPSERGDGARPNPYSSQRSPTTQRPRDGQEKFSPEKYSPEKYSPEKYSADSEEFTEADFQAAYAAAPPALRELLKRQWEATQAQRKANNSSAVGATPVSTAPVSTALASTPLASTALASTPLAGTAQRSSESPSHAAPASQSPHLSANDQAATSFRLSDTDEDYDRERSATSPNQHTASLPRSAEQIGVTRYDLRESRAEMTNSRPRQLEGLQPPARHSPPVSSAGVEPIDTGYAEHAVLAQAAARGGGRRDEPSAQSLIRAEGLPSQTSSRRDSEVVPASAEQRVDVRGVEARAEARTTSGGSASQPAGELDWREHIRAALRLLEDQSEDTARSPVENLNAQATARMLHLAVDDLDEALKPISGLQTHEQEYFRHAFQAIHDATDLGGNPVLARRWTLALDSHRQALAHLSAVSNLEIKNATFCTDVQSYGVISKFPNAHFRPSQELLLYCELDNFVAEPVKEGFETQLQGSYEILDAEGRRVTDVLLPVDSDVCRHQRRDYFIAYRIYMPQQIAKGRYQLRLTIEDMKGRKFGQSTLDFQIMP